MYVMAKKQDNSKIVSILSYFLIGIIWYFVDEDVRKNKDVKFHVKQALNIGIISLVLGIILRGLVFVTFGLFFFVYVLVEIGIFVLWVIGLVNAINMEKRKIPVIGEFADKYLKF